MESTESIKKSYFNILALFIQKPQIETRFAMCLLKWGFQMGLSPEDISKQGKELESIKFTMPTEKVDQLEAIYHLVHMIYLDKVVDDAELEVATIYAEKLGLRPSLVAELFKSIATAVYDGMPAVDVRKEVIDFLKTYE